MARGGRDHRRKSRFGRDCGQRWETQRLNGIQFLLGWASGSWDLFNSSDLKGQKRSGWNARAAKKKRRRGRKSVPLDHGRFRSCLPFP
ncbi:hypothetical protein EMPG_13992 [Blastomyces silverae]|uniref:Uncharacterized protein n=1 Tax=Blastomyces silverae TaxID=2060906 RepID=A0A0H1BGZ4_9EURO|nr:hypothetical protein EMPG_13992 [Blastomyces silverae]